MMSSNYVLQHMLQLKSAQLTELLVSQLQGNFANLSQNKYASNVVEKCLTESRPSVSANIILELVRSPNPSSLLVDPYGNFVIQSALKVSKVSLHAIYNMQKAYYLILYMFINVFGSLIRGLRTSACSS